MALTKCALFYWTSTGILTTKVLMDDDVQYAELIAPQGQSFFLTPTITTLKGQGCPDDVTCLTLIGAHRGLPAASVDADRAAQIDANGNVVAVIKADPANITPAELGLPSNHTFVTALPDVMEGDTYSAGAFHRRWVIANPAGIVLSVTTTPITASGVTPPAFSGAGSFATPHNTAQVGATVGLPKRLMATG